MTPPYRRRKALHSTPGWRSCDGRVALRPDGIIRRPNDPSSRPRGTMTDQPTVLMADESENAARIAEELTREGMAVERVEGVHATLARLDAGGIDVLLLAL